MAAMPEVSETRLPSIGSRFDFVTRGGVRVGVLARHSGRRDLLVYKRDDPDAVCSEVSLSEDEAQLLADLLGINSVTDRIAELTEVIPGLAMDWMPIPDDFRSRSIGETEMRLRTGASIIAVLRDSGSLAAPGSGDRIEPGDTVVMVGTAQGLEAAAALLGL